MYSLLVEYSWVLSRACCRLEKENRSRPGSLKIVVLYTNQFKRINLTVDKFHWVCTNFSLSHLIRIIFLFVAEFTTLTYVLLLVRDLLLLYVAC